MDDDGDPTALMPAGTGEQLLSAVAGRAREPGPVALPRPGPATRTAPSWVYGLGTIEARFPSLGVEKEFAQVAGRSATGGHSDRETLQAVLARPENRYLARQMCWIFTVEGIETFILRPRDPGDLTLLVEAVRPRPRATDVDVVIGTRGPIAPPDACNGLMVPIVAVDQVYSFDRDALVSSIPCPDDVPEERFRESAESLLERIMQLADNAGDTDEHRAVNYLAVRYPAIYDRAARAFADNQALAGVEVRPSRLSGTRVIVDVIFSFTSRETDVTERSFVRVDVTEEFPFLVSRLQHYYER
jgi:hypothetical protein